MLPEEMETFHGILQATTNMTHNLDPAFEQRFLYKIRFQAPDQSMRSQLWKAILPRLKPEQAEQLAAQFPYTPGEMQNIATKLRLRRMLNPKVKYFETVLGLCREEKWGTETPRWLSSEAVLAIFNVVALRPRSAALHWLSDQNHMEPEPLH